MSVKITKPGWSFSVIVLGDDLLVKHTTATWFGGDNDPMDNGQTASGVLTKGNPTLLGCSLPMDYSGPSRSTRVAVGGSPIPMLPWGLTRGGLPKPGGTNVIVTRGDISLTVPLIDIGPARWTKDGIDLTIAAFTALGGHRKQGVIPVSYRVLGGAKFIK
jgi:hypothetical protein